jgi:AcrR family transcriptional regulator
VATTGGTRVRLDAKDRRAQLIGLGLELLSAKPADQVAIDDIAAAAGISRGLLFHYFPSKRDFHLAVAQAAADELLRVTEPDGSLPEIAQLRAGLDGFLNFLEEKHTLYLALVRGAAGADPAFHAIYEANRATVAERICAAVSPGQPPSMLRSAVRGWIAFCEEAMLHWMDHRSVSRQVLAGLCQQVLVQVVGAVVPGDMLPSWFAEAAAAVDVPAAGNRSEPSLP